MFLSKNADKNDKIKILEKMKEIGSSEVDIDSKLNLEFDNGFTSEVNASFSKNLGTETVIKGSNGVMRIMNPWQAELLIISLEGAINKKIKIEYSDNIFSYEINAISKNILEGKFSPDFPGVSIDETIGVTKILHKWLN